VMNKECSALIQLELPTKRRDPGSFHIPCAIGKTMFDRALCDLGASINLLPLSLVKRLQINEIMPTDVIIRLADKTQKQAIGVVENVLLKVGKYFLPTDFIILDMEDSHTHPIILGRPFLATARALIDVEKGELILRCPLGELLVSCIVVGVVTSLVLVLILLTSPPKVWVVSPSRVVSLGVWIIVFPW